ncbi:DUF1499 domain-containing protein [Cereibacter sp. SYSU M97828]|nr:DUF1499 domain-containing protein [Cereibacter flavus]
MSFPDLLILFLVAIAIGWAFLRYTPSDSQDWHVDPVTVRKSRRPNNLLVTKHVALPPDQAAARLEALALATPRTSHFAGEGFHRTWITLSALGLPTFTSVRLVPENGGTKVVVYARARYLSRLPGSQKARVKGWLAQL